MNRFKNKIVLVTGAGSGIGRSTAMRLDQEGATLIIADINKDQLNETKNMLTNESSSAMVLDISDLGQTQACFETIKKEYYYVCEFKWKSYGERKDFFDLEEAKKMRELPPTIRTDHLLFMIYWEEDFSCWQRVQVLACLNASSHQEAADWMLKEITTKGSDVPEHGSEYFKNGTLEVIK